MKKTLFMALAVFASASFFTASAAKKDNKKKEKPAKLVTSSDSVSYAGGISLTNGLIQYLEKSEGVDTAYMADFIRGFQDAIAKGDSPSQKAYAAGISIAARINGQMLTKMVDEFKDSPDEINRELVLRGFTDALANDTTHFTQQAAESYFQAKREADKEAKDLKLYGDNKKAGEDFLAENAKKDSVVVLPSGLQYKVVTMGNGPKPKETDRVQVHYEGRLIDGTVFDASSKRGPNPASFAANQVIKGWTEALTLMPVGSKWQLYIPQELAYGNRMMGQIKPFSALIFDIELVGTGANTKASKQTKLTPGRPARPEKVDPAVLKRSPAPVKK